MGEWVNEWTNEWMKQPTVQPKSQSQSFLGRTTRTRSQPQYKTPKKGTDLKIPCYYKILRMGGLQAYSSCYVFCPPWVLAMQNPFIWVNPSYPFFSLAFLFWPFLCASIITQEDNSKPFFYPQHTLTNPTVWGETLALDLLYCFFLTRHSVTNCLFAVKRVGLGWPLCLDCFRRAQVSESWPLNSQSLIA